jgi:hypothetical protein
MFQLSRLQRVWLTAILLCLAFLGLALIPGSAIKARADSDQTLYMYQGGTPAAIQNFVDIGAGCNWAGIGGQVFDLSGAPMAGLIVKVSGSLEGRQIQYFVYTGSSQHFGPGGFNLKLADHPVSSSTLELLLLDAAGEPLSGRNILQTFNNCQQNLLVVNLVPRLIENPVYLPVISR